MKKFFKSLLAIIFLSLFTSSNITFAAEVDKEKEELKVDYQKKEIDNIVSSYKSKEALEKLSEYKIDNEGLSADKEKELIEYKSNSFDEVKKKYDEIEESNKIKRYAEVIVLAVFAFSVIFLVVKSSFK